MKDFFTALTAKDSPMYVVPLKRYYYWTPKSFKRRKHTHTGEALVQGVGSGRDSANCAAPTR